MNHHSIVDCVKAAVVAFTGFAVAICALSADVYAGVGKLSTAVVCREATPVSGRAPSLLPPGKDFRLVWHDEFDGASLDFSKWSYRTNYWGRRALWYATAEDGCVELRDGICFLRVRRLPNGQYVSPQLQTGGLMWDIPRIEHPRTMWSLPPLDKPKFEHRYGYYECRCRLQREKGWWSAFWMQSASQGVTHDPGRSGVESDIMEAFEPGTVSTHCFHYNGTGADHRRFDSYRCTADGKKIVSAEVQSRIKAAEMNMGSDEFHVYGLLWEPDGYTVFIDGRQSGAKVGAGPGEAVSHTPQFILVSTEVKGYRLNKATGVHDPDIETAASKGDNFAVDYVRVFDIVDARKDTGK